MPDQPLAGGSSRDRRVAKRQEDRIAQKVLRQIGAVPTIPSPSPPITTRSMPDRKTSLRAKLWNLWESPILWGGVGVLIGAVASLVSLKYLFVAAGVVLAVAVWRVDFFGRLPRLRLAGNCFLCVILAGAMFLLWRVIPKPKDPPTLDQQMDAFARRFPGLGFQPTTATPVFQLPKAAEHTHVEFLSVLQASQLVGVPDLRFQIRAQEKPVIPVSFRNPGEFTVGQPSDSSLLVLIPATKIATIFRDNRDKLNFNPPGGSIPAHSPNAAYHTVEGPLLTDGDTAKLKAGELALCGIGAVRWSDDTGRYETRFLQCLFAEPNHQSLNWHSMKDNNEEYKLH